MIGRFLYLIFGTLALHTSSFACIVDRPLKETTIAMSDVVLVGRPSGYEQHKSLYWGGMDSFVTFDVIEVLAGAYTQKQIKAHIPVSTFGAPSSLNEFREWYGELVKFGAILPETYSKWCVEKHIGTGTAHARSYVNCSHKNVLIEITPKNYPNMPVLIRQNCTRLYIEKVE